ncbi:hypothetical protein ABZ614_36065 [Streptomyces sp. NPDC013178]|uniref:hypothetical protein n=1 Tax=Streptomyces sp. NPDC013178 TaxID=3155118 RepID=UPI0033C3CE39
MEDRSGSSGPNQDEIAELRARADAGDRNAAGRLGELLARHGDREGALRVWARAYGDRSPTTKRLAELMAEQGDLAGAVNVWVFSDAVWQNPASFHEEYLDTLDPLDRADEDDPEDWAFMEREQLANLLADRGDEASLAELRALAEAGDAVAAKRLRQLDT